MADDNHPIRRRNFLVGAGTALAASVAPPQVEAQSAAAGTGLSAATPAVAQTPTAAAPAAAQPEPLLALNETEFAFVVTAVDTLIPADELSPSGSDCGVAVFIDRQLASAWGGGAKMYRSGPFAKGKPEQGYQLPLTPAEYFTAGIAAANTWSRKTYGRDFDRLDPEKRIEALKAMEEGKAELEDFSARGFFARLLAMTMQGFFADPIYGGNRNKAGWKMLGFPGLPATYANLFEEYRDKPYAVEPQSIADFS